MHCMQLGFKALDPKPSCAAGDFYPEGDDATRLHFTRFWVDRGEQLVRPKLAEGDLTPWDKIVTVLGRIGFLEGHAKFPVLYVDEDLTVFRFPPLGVNIGAHRVQTPEAGK